MGAVHEVERVLERIWVLVILVLLCINIRFGKVCCRFLHLLVVYYELGKKPYYRVVVRVCNVTGRKYWLPRTSKGRYRHYRALGLVLVKTEQGPGGLLSSSRNWLPVASVGNWEHWWSSKAVSCVTRSTLIEVSIRVPSSWPRVVLRLLGADLLGTSVRTNYWFRY